MEQGGRLIRKSSLCHGPVNDDNKMFQKMDELGQDYVILLNFYITICMAFLGMISIESETNALKVSIIKSADPIKKEVFFCYYRLVKGICDILSYAKEDVRLWFQTKRPVYRQLCLRLVL